MNKIKISNEQERIKIEFDFDNIQVAREYFQNEECIEDIVEALDYKLEEEEPKENELLNELKKQLKETLCKGSNYKAKITQTSTNDDGSESSKSYFLLCNADSLPKATKLFQEHLKGTIEDATLDSVTKTKIVDLLT